MARGGRPAVATAGPSPLDPARLVAALAVVALLGALGAFLGRTVKAGRIVAAGWDLAFNTLGAVAAGVVLAALAGRPAPTEAILGTKRPIFGRSVPGIVISGEEVVGPGGMSSSGAA